MPSRPAWPPAAHVGGAGADVPLQRVASASPLLSAAAADAWSPASGAARGGIPVPGSSADSRIAAETCDDTPAGDKSAAETDGC